MNMEISHALSSMCYREVSAGIWAKPVGNVLFTFTESTKVWTNWFFDINDNKSIWETRTLEEDDQPLSFLKQAEMSTRIDVCSSRQSTLHLSSEFI